MSSASPKSLNDWILALAERGPAHVDPGPFLDLLKRQLRVRRLHKPAWLGLRDHLAWDEPALLELCGILYERFLIAKVCDYARDARLRDVTGLVIRTLHWRLIDLQRDADPEGFAVYKNVEQAVTAAIESGSLRLEGREDPGRRKLDNRSLLCTATGSELRLDLDPVEIHRRLTSHPSWPALRQDMSKLSEIQSEGFLQLLLTLAHGAPLRFRMADLVDAVKLECCPQIESGEAIAESLGKCDELPMADLRAHESALREAIVSSTPHKPRQARIQNLLTRCFDNLDEKGELIDAADHARHNSLSQSSAYEDLDLLRKILMSILTGNSRKNAD